MTPKDRVDRVDRVDTGTTMKEPELKKQDGGLKIVYISTCQVFMSSCQQLRNQFFLQDAHQVSLSRLPNGSGVKKLVLKNQF